MGSARCNLLWAAQNEWDYHGGSLSTSIDAFESILKRKTADIRVETRHSDFVAWQRSTSCYKSSENLPENASLGSSTPPALFTWDNIAPSDFHPFHSMTHGLADQRFHSYKEAKKWIDSWIVSKDMSFSDAEFILPERWEKVVSSDGQYFNWNVFVRYILNKVFIL